MEKVGRSNKDADQAEPGNYQNQGYGSLNGTKKPPDIDNDAPQSVFKLCGWFSVGTQIFS